MILQKKNKIESSVVIDLTEEEDDVSSSPLPPAAPRWLNTHVHLEGETNLENSRGKSSGSPRTEPTFLHPLHAFPLEGAPLEVHLANSGRHCVVLNWDHRWALFELHKFSLRKVLEVPLGDRANRIDFMFSGDSQLLVTLEREMFYHRNVLAVWDVAEGVPLDQIALVGAANLIGLRSGFSGNANERPTTTVVTLGAVSNASKSTNLNSASTAHNVPSSLISGCTTKNPTPSGKPAQMMMRRSWQAIIQVQSEVRVFELLSRQDLNESQILAAKISQCALSTNGRFLATTSEHGYMTIYDLEEQRQTFHIPIENENGGSTTITLHSITNCGECVTFSQTNNGKLFFYVYRTTIPSQATISLTLDEGQYRFAPSGLGLVFNRWLDDRLDFYTCTAGLNDLEESIKFSSQLKQARFSQSGELMAVLTHNGMCRMYCVEPHRAEKLTILLCARNLDLQSGFYWEWFPIELFRIILVWANLAFTLPD